MRAVPPLDGVRYRDVRRELSGERRGQLLKERATKRTNWGVMSMGDHPSTPAGKRCCRIVELSLTKVGKFDWYSDSPEGGMN